MKATATTLLLILGLIALPTSGFAETFLVENGRPNAEIVIAKDPPRPAELAAEELRTYLEKITGSRLDIVTSPTAAVAVKIFVGESELARQMGVTAEGLQRDAFRMISGNDTSGNEWLALVGSDVEFVPREPWGHNRSDWLGSKQKQWEKLAGHPWNNPVGASLYKDYNKKLDIWSFDHRGSLNAVYAFLRELGVRSVTRSGSVSDALLHRTLDRPR